jgi:LuxR family maltose regulon positive regulatory protein
MSTTRDYVPGSDSNIPTSDDTSHFVRPRINTLLTQATQAPLTIVCGGMGCGKTRAVYDFAQQCDFPVMWLRFSNVNDPISHFWQIFVHAIATTNKPLANELITLGFPHTPDKLNIYYDLQNRLALNVRRLYVFDEFHLLKDAAVLNFLEQIISNFNTKESESSFPSLLMITRENPSINISSLVIRDKVSIINENELNFTENELHQFLLRHGLNSEVKHLSTIHQDTAGWALIINFSAQVLKKTPGYMGYARNIIQQDITQLIEMEVWKNLSDSLKRLFLYLALTTHRSIDLVHLLAGKDNRLILDLNKQNVFAYYDKFTNVYHIQSLFLDFLQTKQGLLSDDERLNAHQTIADWCVKNDFLTDAMYFYEKTGAYEKIVSFLFTSSPKFFADHAPNIVKIFHHAPEEVFDGVELSAAMHIQLVLATRQWQKGLDLIRFYEAKYLRLPEDDAFRNRMLGCIYYYWGIVRVVLCQQNNRYDFDTYFAKQYAYLKNFSLSPKCWYQHHPGVWSCLINSDKSSLREYLDAVSRGSQFQQKAAGGLTAGIGELCQSEALFYQGKIPEAESYAIKAIEKAGERGQYEIASRALFYMMRIAVFQGDYQKFELSLKDIERQLPSGEYSLGFLTYDIVLGWYYYVLDQTEKMPSWLQGEFICYSEVPLYEYFGNYLKARYCYLTKNYNKLLTYLGKKKQQEITLFDRVEVLTVQANVYVKINDREMALSALQEAYQLALPHGIVMPFIELGKDMRALIDSAAKCPDCALPHQWLKCIRQKASVHARNQARIVSEYNKAHGIHSKITLSPRENTILHDLLDGLSRSEIAAKRALSVNTVKLHINNIYRKLGAHNKADMFRIVSEENIV